MYLLSQYLDMASYKCDMWEIGICCHNWRGGGIFFYFTKPGFLGILKKILILKVGFPFSNTKGRIPSESENVYVLL